MATRTVRERPSIFRKTGEGVPELQDGETTTRQDIQASSGQDIQTSDSRDAQPSMPPKIKATFHLTPEDIIGIDTLITEEFRRTGHRPQRSEIVGRGIRALLDQQSR